MPGAIVTLSLTLYPYVYLLARAALRDQAADAYLVARTLGALVGRGDAAGRAADAAPGDRRRRRGRRDGDADRLRHRAVLRRRHRDGRACSGSGAARTTATPPARSPRWCSCSRSLAIGLERVAARPGPLRRSPAARAPASSRRRCGGGAARGGDGARPRSSCSSPSAPRSAQLVTWAIDEQRGDRGHAAARARTWSFLGNSLRAHRRHGGDLPRRRRGGHQRPPVRPTRASSRPANRLGVGRLRRARARSWHGRVLALVALDDLLGGIGLGLPGSVATGSFIALAYAYVRPLPGARPEQRSRPGSAQVPDEVTASARSLGARPLAGCSVGSTCRCPGRACSPPRCSSASTPSRSCRSPAAAPDRVRHAAGVGLQPGLGVALRAGRAARR